MGIEGDDVADPIYLPLILPEPLRSPETHVWFSCADSLHIRMAAMTLTRCAVATEEPMYASDPKMVVWRPYGW